MMAMRGWGSSLQAGRRGGKLTNLGRLRSDEREQIDRHGHEIVGFSIFAVD